MGKLQPAEYYDGIYSNPKFGYKNHYSKSHYRRLWAFVIGAISAILDEKNKPFILELGCGPGQFASMLFDTLGGNDKFFAYKGLDFSAEAIKIARGVLPGERVTLPFFYEADCLNPATYSEHQAQIADLIVAMEIFEHTDDLQILTLIPPGKQLIVTVPDFDDPAHIRHFKTEEDVRGRYSNFIEIEKLTKFERWYVLIGKTK